MKIYGENKRSTAWVIRGNFYIREYGKMQS